MMNTFQRLASDGLCAPDRRWSLSGEEKIAILPVGVSMPLTFSLSSVYKCLIQRGFHCAKYEQELYCRLLIAKTFPYAEAESSELDSMGKKTLLIQHFLPITSNLLWARLGLAFSIFLV